MEDNVKSSDTIDRMFKAGAHFGYSKRTRHSSVSPFIFGTKNRVEIFDLEKTSELLDEAKKFAKSLGEEEKTLLFVSGKNEAARIVREGAESVQMPYVAGRWIGGTITNFSEISKRVKRLLDLQSQKEKGELAKKYTKKEQLLIDREITKLERNFGGIVALGDKLPAALFVIDTKKENIAVREARDKNIPVIGLLNTDCNLEEVNYPIPANDSSIKSIALFVEEIASSYKDGLRNKKVVPEVKKENSEDK